MDIKTKINVTLCSIVLSLCTSICNAELLEGRWKNNRNESSEVESFKYTLELELRLNGECSMKTNGNQEAGGLKCYYAESGSNKYKLWFSDQEDQALETIDLETASMKQHFEILVYNAKEGTITFKQKYGDVVLYALTGKK